MVRDDGELPSRRDWVCGEGGTVVSRPNVKVRPQICSA